MSVTLRQALYYERPKRKKRKKPRDMEYPLIKTLLTRIHSKEFFTAFSKTNPVNLPTVAAENAFCNNHLAPEV